jgi:hypothetical protein
MAIEFTRFRMKQTPGKIKYPGIYLMNAIEKGFSLGDAEKRRIAGKDVISTNPELGAQKKIKDTEAKNILEEAKNALANLSGERKQEISLAYTKSSAGILLCGETDPDKMLSHPRAGAGFAVFLLKAI